MARLTAADIPLFNGITSDLFPGVEVPVLDYGEVGDTEKERELERERETSSYSFSHRCRSLLRRS